MHNYAIGVVFSYFRLSLVASVAKFLIARCKFSSSREHLWTFAACCSEACKVRWKKKRELKGVYRCAILRYRVGNWMVSLQLEREDLVINRLRICRKSDSVKLHGMQMREKNIWNISHRDLCFFNRIFWILWTENNSIATSILFRMLYLCYFTVKLIVNQVITKFRWFISEHCYFGRKVINVQR